MASKVNKEDFRAGVLCGLHEALRRIDKDNKQKQRELHILVSAEGTHELACEMQAWRGMLETRAGLLWLLERLKGLPVDALFAREAGLGFGVLEELQGAPEDNVEDVCPHKRESAATPASAGD